MLAAAMLAVAVAGALAADRVADDARLPHAGPCAIPSAPPCARLGVHGLSGPWIPAGRRLTYASGRPETGVVERLDAFGLTVSEITGKLASRFRISQSVAGVVVTEVAAAGFASAGGLAVGDVLVEFDQDPIAGPGDLSSRFAALAAGEARSALVLVYRDYEHRFTVLVLD
jgi:membrane-associated protease RseP (regulator of RpoE activity)